MRSLAVLAALALLASQAAEARSPASRCLANPDRVGPCRRVHGRLTAYNGNPAFRIWVVGTHRVLGVLGNSWRETEDGDMLPPQIRAALGADPFRTLVFADFRACPLTRARAGWMQFVCVTDARRLYVVRF